MSCFSFGSGSIELDRKTYIMGILNTTPDSFSDGGKYFAPDTAVLHALTMQKQGADIIDIGAQSTRPGNTPLSSDEEWERLKNVLPALIQTLTVPLSVDTFYPAVAEKCLNMGVSIINDVSGVFEPDMARLIKAYRAGWCVMHGGVKTNTGERSENYPLGVVNHVQLFFDEILQKAEDFGISPTQICLDPGFGFGKTHEQNTQLLGHLELLQTQGSALLVALSRKRFIGALSHDDNVQGRLPGTLSANVVAALSGANIIRVHDVEPHRKALMLIDAVKNS